MKWTAKQVDRLILEMAAQAKSASWSDRHAVDRMRILTQILKHYGWVRRDQHPPEVCNAAVAIAFYAPGTHGNWGVPGHALRLQVLGCLIAESHCEKALHSATQGNTSRRWFWLWNRGSRHSGAGGDTIAHNRVVREQAARLLDKALSEVGGATVFGTTQPKLRRGRLVYPDLCCPNDLLWLRCSLGTPEMGTSVQPK